MRRIDRPLACLTAIASAVGIGGTPALAGDVLSRTPNINSVIAPPAGSVDLYFNHRMTGMASITSAPTLMLDVGLAPWLTLYTAYASKAAAVGPLGMGAVTGSHDLGFGLRQAILSQEATAPISLMLHQGISSIGLKGGDEKATRDVWYTGGLTANSLQGGLGATIGRTFGPVGLVGAVRAVGYQYAMVGNTLHAQTGVRTSGTIGASWAITPFLSVAGDYGKYFDSLADVPAWSAGIQGQIPYSPHYLALEVSNVPTTTMSGISQASPGSLYVGFAFTALFRRAHRWQRMLTPTWLGAPEKVSRTLTTPRPAITPELIARGFELYDNAAADSGCASCHGDHPGRGDDDGPPIAGMTVAEILDSFEDPDMEDFRDLGDDDLYALEAYLGSVE